MGEHARLTPEEALQTRYAAAPRLLALLLPAAFSMYATFQGLQLVLLPAQMEAFEPSHKVARLALLTTLCSVTSVVGLVSGGAVSDATRSRWGRRRPWLAVMGAASASLLLLLAFVANLTALIVAATSLWFTLNFFQAVLLAVIPDRIAPEDRAFASWAFGFGGPIGVLFGVNIGALASPRLAYAALAALLGLATAALVALAPEPPHRPPRDETPAGLGGKPGFPFLRLAESFRRRDFAIAFGARALLFLAQYMIGGYLFYALQDYVGLAALPAGGTAAAVGRLNTLSTAASVATLVGAGWALRRTHKRRIFFAAYAVLNGVALSAPALFPTWPAMVVYAVFGGAAWGVFASVDLALLALVLPSEGAVGRDMGWLGVAGSGPELVAPTLGASVISAAGYSPLFGLAAVISLAAGGLAWRLRVAP